MVAALSTTISAQTTVQSSTVIVAMSEARSRIASRSACPAGPVHWIAPPASGEERGNPLMRQPSRQLVAQKANGADREHPNRAQCIFWVSHCSRLHLLL